MKTTSGNTASAAPSGHALDQRTKTTTNNPSSIALSRLPAGHILEGVGPHTGHAAQHHHQQRIQTTCCATRNGTNFAVTATENTKTRVATLIDVGASPAHITIQQPSLQQQATTNGMTNATLSKQLPMQPPPVDDDNFNHAADPTARSPTTSECSDQRGRLSTMSCSALAAASGSSAVAADVCPAAGRTGRRSSSAASSPSENGNLENASACCAGVVMTR